MRTKQDLAQPSSEISASLAAPDPGRQENHQQAGALETKSQDDHDLHGVQGKPVPGSAITMPINEVRAEHWQGRAEAADTPG